MTSGGDRDLVMFDHDGVVVESFTTFSAAFIDACQAAGVAGAASEDEVLNLFDDNLFDALRAHGADEAQIAQVVGRTGEMLIRAAHWLKPVPLVAQVIEELSDARVVAILTSSPAEVVEHWLKRHAVHGIAEVVGAESGQSKTEKIRRLVERFPGQSVYWYVCDTAGDVREALATGVTPLGVAWGWHEPERLVRAGAEHIATTPAELLTLVAPELAGDFFGAR